MINIRPVSDLRNKYPEIENFILEVKKTAREILSRLKFENKKKDNLDDLEFVINALISACDSKNLLVINGLVISINYVSHKFKNVRYLVRDLNDLIYDYYDFLAENSQKNAKIPENFENLRENSENFEEEFENEDEEE